MKAVNPDIDPNERHYVFGREAPVTPQMQRIRYASKRIDVRKIDYLINKIDGILK